MSDTNNESKVIGKFDITPPGLQTPEGVERVRVAQAAWESAQVDVANDTYHFLRRHRNTLREALECYAQRYGSEDADELREDLKELSEKSREMSNLQEEFLLAVANRPSRRVPA